MNTICSALQTFWNSLYNTFYGNLGSSARITIGLILLILSIIFFILCARGKKAELINNWFWFWISMIAFIISVLYLSH